MASRHGSGAENRQYKYDLFLFHPVKLIRTFRILCIEQYRTSIPVRYYPIIDVDRRQTLPARSSASFQHVATSFTMSNQPPTTTFVVTLFPGFLYRFWYTEAEEPEIASHSSNPAPSTASSPPSETQSVSLGGNTSHVDAFLTTVNPSLTTAHPSSHASTPRSDPTTSDPTTTAATTTTSGTPASNSAVTIATATATSATPPTTATTDAVVMLHQISLLVWHAELSIHRPFQIGFSHTHPYDSLTRAAQQERDHLIARIHALAGHQHFEALIPPSCRPPARITRLRDCSTEYLKHLERCVTHEIRIAEAGTTTTVSVTTIH